MRCTRGALQLHCRSFYHLIRPYSKVEEETGYNLAGRIDPEDVIELSIREQKISLYIVPGVPENYPFQTKTRKEISVSER